MFKRFTAFILLLAFVSQTFASPFIMLDYYVNTAAYAKNCINKARPKMHCNGQCQMMKKIREQEKKDQQNTDNKVERMLMALSSKSFFALLTIPARSSSLLLFYKVSGSPVDRNISVFHPPQPEV
jgi:hypothetical protein